ncbi:DUF6090 family protein [Winogradskyella aquimaris]|uniref:DUF6090 family protein n=1 Tax=Winogradskyella aquimaris TaxID=864074 RepID=A0ABU5EPC6_9FLAO|nr:DUF6090 family protein [Winogradskyella aquimaris]MDY2587550.1 DUF6090 family protein [Winogradskyella aquimaris]
MFKFFRRMRQRLLGENRISKYLLYAIGEIVLVVIGILIALQINNWNTKRIENQQEQNLLLSLKQEFKLNLKELQRDHKINVASQSAALALLQENRVNYSPKQLDSLVGKALNFATFDARIGIISEAIASGKLALIKSDELKNHLSQWTGELNDLQEDVVIRRDYWIHNASTLFRKYIPLRNMNEAQYRSDYHSDVIIERIEVPAKNYNIFLNSLEVDGVIYDLYVNQKFVTINEASIEAYILKVLNLLEENIEYD